MVRLRPSIIGVIGCMLAALTPPSFGASSPIVVESRTSENASSPQAQQDVRGARELPFQPPVEEEAGGPAGGGETLYQLQLLQQEVQQLRGQVEKLEYEISRMKATQEDRYLELDGRFQNLTEQLSAGDRGSAGLDLEMPGLAAGEGTEEAALDAKEKEIYEAALEMIRSRDYGEAIDQLQRTIEQYPDGRYTPNAYYWLGEVYAAKPEPDYEKARQALAQVITYFPDHRKVPDAAFKLGKVYHLMGDCQRAKDILTQVMQQQKGKSVGKLAESYLQDNINCQ